MTGTRRRASLSTLVICATLAPAWVTGCGSSLDPEPEKLDGSESREFEQKDLDAAEGAGRLVEIYCDGGVSEAQVLGCLSHVTEQDVCDLDTAGKQAAVSAYREEVGGVGICE